MEAMKFDLDGALGHRIRVSSESLITSVFLLYFEVCSFLQPLPVFLLLVLG